MQDMSPTNQSIRTLSNYMFMCVMIIIHLASARSVVLVFGHTMYFPVVKGELWNLLVIDSKLRVVSQGIFIILKIPVEVYLYYIITEIFNLTCLVIRSQFFVMPLRRTLACLLIRHGK